MAKMSHRKASRESFLIGAVEFPASLKCPRSRRFLFRFTVSLDLRGGKGTTAAGTLFPRVSSITHCAVVAGHSIPVESFGRIQLWGDLMQIRRVDAQDAGRYICRASNQLGEQRAETHLSVTSKLNARIQPRVQVRSKLVVTVNVYALEMTALIHAWPGYV